MDWNEANIRRASAAGSGTASSHYAGQGWQRAGGRFNTGRTTLQSSATTKYRRRMASVRMNQHRSALEQPAVDMASEQQSVNYENLEELFHESDDETPLVVSRSPTETRNVLSVKRADSAGNVQAAPTVRQVIGYYLDTSATGRRWDQVDAFLNAAIVAVHVFNTTRIRTGHLHVPYGLLVTEAVLAAVLLVQFIPRYLLAPDPLEYLRSLFSVITIIGALTPIAVVANIYIDPDVYGTFMSAGIWVFLYPVIFWRLQPALLRCLVPIKNVYHMSPMTRNIMRALTTVFTTVLAITVLTHTMVYMQHPDKGEVQGFDEALFFISVSAITGLQSDIEPDTWFTRSIVLFVMFIGIFWLPPRVSEMLSLWNDRSPWPKEFEAEINQSHVILICDLEYASLFEFLREFFCEDHGIRTVNTVVVVMSENEPSKEVAELLCDPSYVNRVKFVLGSPTSFKQLEEVQASAAAAIFLLSSKAADNAEKEDAAKVMTALAIRKFLRTRGSQKRVVPIYAQVLLPETTMHLEYLTDHVICVEELRLGLLAQSVMVPGLASLLQLLSTSIPANTTDQLVRVAQRAKLPWLGEYTNGMTHEIYATKLSPIFSGMKFQRAAQLVFQRCGATLFALRIPDRENEIDPDEGRVLINPVDYEIRGDETGFVITSDSLVSTQVSRLTESAVVDVNDEAAEETAPLVDNTDERTHEHLFRHKDGKLHTGMPFGKNVMDTLVVAEDPHSKHDRESTSSIKSDSKNNENDAAKVDDPDLIDLEGGDDDGDDDARSDKAMAALPIGLGDIIDEGKGTTSDGPSDAAVAAAPTSEDEAAPKFHRAPLVFDPSLQKDSDAEKKGDGKEPKSLPSSEGGPSGPGFLNVPQGIFGSSTLTLPRAHNPPVTVEPTPDGLPGDLAGHIVVCDTSDEFPSNIVYLISCIRTAAIKPANADEEPKKDKGSKVAGFSSLYDQISRSYGVQASKKADKSPDENVFQNPTPIVILSPGELSSEQQTDLERFGGIYVVSGSPLSRTDLARVRIHVAQSAIVLANKEEALGAATDKSTKLSLAGSDTTATATADAPVLLSVLNIEALTYSNPDFFLSIEFVHRENMQFVGDTETIRINEVYAQAFLRPSFMAGRVYAPVMLDTLVCQAYYNSHVIEIMRKLVFSHGNVASALGRAKLSRAGISDAAGYVKDPSADDVTSHVFLCGVPARFHGTNYSSLFSYCCFKHKAISIGMYRSVVHRRQPLWYVLPNPSPETVIREGDFVYLLASSNVKLE